MDFWRAMASAVRFSNSIGEGNEAEAVAGQIRLREAEHAVTLNQLDREEMKLHREMTGFKTTDA
jgi:hypothetical protein